MKVFRMCEQCGWVGVSLANHLHRSARHRDPGMVTATDEGGVVDCTPLFAQMEAARAAVRERPR